MSQPLKILVCGDVEGRYNQLFKRVEAIQKKTGNFDMLFCVGSFFGEDNSDWQNYTTGEKTVPIPTFILGPNQQKHRMYFAEVDGCELCHNVTYLGRRGLYTSSSGLTVAYLSGVESGSTTASTSPDTYFDQDDITALTTPVMTDTKYKGLDILLTSQWPRAIDKYSIKCESVDTNKVGSQVISQIALCLKPRYHICALEGEFYERQPYRNHKILQQTAEHVTRVIALAKVGNTHKMKFIYAFNISPLKHMEAGELNKQPPDATECPYTMSTNLIYDKTKEEKSAQFFYDQKALSRGDKSPRGGKRSQDKQGGPQHKKHVPQPTGPCWFCLGSPEVDKHLVVSVGTHCYLALAKGGLTPDHCLILPIGHHQSTVSAPDDIMQEIDRYKVALKKCFKSQGKCVVFYERNYKSQHLQIQAVPLPADLSGEIQETFEGCALSQKIELHEIPALSDLKQIVPAGAPYFYTELPSGVKLLYRITRGFPLQFGRDALAHDTLLDLPHRVDWKNCKASKPEETEMTKAFRDIFQKYDFNDL